MTPTVHLPLILNQEPRLKDLFGRHGIRFGFGVSASCFADAPWNKARYEIVTYHANIAAIANGLKMEFTQPIKNVWDFSEGDAIVEAAHRLGIDVYGHALSWHMQNPDWLHAGEFDRDELAEILAIHVEAVSRHFKNKVCFLDVANEAYIQPDGGVFGGEWQSLDEDYVTISFQSSGVTPLYNSFFPHPEHEYAKALNLVDEGRAQAIGIQLHVWDGSYQNTLYYTELLLKRIRERNGWCRFSEISVLAGSDWAQSIVYAEITALAIKYKDIVRDFVVWDIKDPGWRGNVTLYDRDGKPKRAYAAMIEELRK